MEQLAGIQRELSRTGLRLGFRDRVLEEQYRTEQASLQSLHNRVAVALLIGLFDLYLIPELRSAPEAVGFAAHLRLEFLTPAGLMFLVLDWRGQLGRFSRPAAMALLIAPNVSGYLESFRTTSPSALSFFQAEPLMQLVVLICRLSLVQIVIVNTLSCVLFTTIALTAAFVPGDVAPSLIMTDLAICLGTLVFSWRLDLRDRQIFLFTLQAQIGREMLAGQNRTLARLTQVDALTGIGNRRCFDQLLETLWSADASNPVRVSLILFDIDCFKQYNDGMGHQAGDECLAEIARTVAGSLRDQRDTVVRYGGEEFAVVLPDTALDDACVVAERIRQSICALAIPHPGAGPRGVVTVSLGVSTVMAPLQDACALIRSADRCLYDAKRNGRNCVVRICTENVGTRAAYHQTAY